jgi:probable rRNA maturation factor
MTRVVVQISKDFVDIEVNLSKLKRLVKVICSRFGHSDINRNGIKCSEATQYDIGIAIVDESEIRRANKQFLNRNVSTDCLSFDLSEEANKRAFELIVNAEKAVEEAVLRGHSAEAELALYVTHGLLHNLGFDDSTNRRAKEMHDTEDEILHQHGYGLVYNS